MSSLLWFLFFFFQAEDGIRDVAVTGVQTCALPISIGGPLVLQRYSPRQAVCLRRRNWLESRGPPQSGRIRSTRALRLGLQYGLCFWRRYSERTEPRREPRQNRRRLSQIHSAGSQGWRAQR